jgi:catechol 2,3-dioxygenase-like lactoylglutathione lyase family enzyme
MTPEPHLSVTWALDHAGFTVPDLDQAVAFFCEVFGFELVCEAGPYNGVGYVWPGEQNAEEATLRLALLRLGEHHNVELLEYRKPGQPEPEPMRPSTVGNGHLALYVTDIEGALEDLRARDGVRALGEVIRESDGPLAGLEWVYAMLPWGMVVELIRWPLGMPYERSTSARLASPPALRTTEPRSA